MILLLKNFLLLEASRRKGLHCRHLIYTRSSLDQDEWYLWKSNCLESFCWFYLLLNQEYHRHCEKPDIHIVLSQTAESKGSHIQRPIIYSTKSLPPPRENLRFFVPGNSRWRGDGACMTEKRACLNLISAVRHPALTGTTIRHFALKGRLLKQW